MLDQLEQGHLGIGHRRLLQVRVRIRTLPKIGDGHLIRGSFLHHAPGHYLRTRYKFSSKIVDFVIEDRASGAILALVELDDRSHDAARDRQRDAMTASAGYRTVRLHAGTSTSATRGGA
ncbi:DUF2726 domain-containing protein [Sphingomonas sp. UYP23]